MHTCVYCRPLVPLLAELREQVVDHGRAARGERGEDAGVAKAAGSAAVERGERLWDAYFGTQHASASEAL